MSIQGHTEPHSDGTIPVVGGIEGKLAPIWGDGAFENETSYRAVMLGLVGEAYHSAIRLDFSRVDCLYRVLEFSRPFCRQEPLASGYDLGQQLFGVLAAEIAANLHLWPEAYNCIAKVHRILAAADARRHAAGVPARRNGETRWCGLRVLAECKWQEPEESRDRLMTPEQIIYDYFHYDRCTRDSIDQHPEIFTSAARVGRLTDSLAWTNYVIAKMALRYEPKRVITLVRYFNLHNGPSLAVTPGHFRSNAPLGGDHWYWGFELAKLYLLGELTPADFEYCTQMCARTRGAKKTSQLGCLGAKMTHNLMRRSCQRRMKVVEGA